MEQGGSRSLICTGTQGSGKTVLLANLVGNTNIHAKKSTVISYFFCEHDVIQSLTARTVIGSLARQFFSQSPLDDESVLLPHSDLFDLDMVRILARRRLPAEYKVCFVLDGITHCPKNDY
ncbi:uncharacterized protein BDV17DRAFT_276097 [Aspergillus undulatus]|uniref:uncharacterized protein n=1 Tax=Aspergillus undulatus TaxID=1810928 RepID=UPI003CCD8F78